MSQSTHIDWILTLRQAIHLLQRAMQHEGYGSVNMPRVFKVWNVSWNITCGSKPSVCWYMFLASPSGVICLHKHRQAHAEGLGRSLGEGMCTWSVLFTRFLFFNEDLEISKNIQFYIKTMPSRRITYSCIWYSHREQWHTRAMYRPVIYRLLMYNIDLVDIVIVDRALCWSITSLCIKRRGAGAYMIIISSVLSTLTRLVSHRQTNLCVFGLTGNVTRILNR